MTVWLSEPSFSRRFCRRQLRSCGLVALVQQHRPLPTSGLLGVLAPTTTSQRPGATLAVLRNLSGEQSGVAQASYFGSLDLNGGVLNYINGAQAKTRQATDTGSLLGNSPASLGIGVTRRSPIVTENKVRGNKVGPLVASGSYWVPARMDLDTLLSKIDSRIVEDVTVIKGPYAARYGPGFDFVDVQLKQSPRYANGFESHGSTSLDYRTNGEQWYGRQSFWGGDADSGFLIGYGHRTGNDYESGDGTEIPSSYNSRDWNFAYGMDLSDDSRFEFSYLRLDQTDVEFPGQAFDMDYLVTDAYELQYYLEDSRYFDSLFVESWYNRTRFEGNAQRQGKRRQFPYFDTIDYEALTDVDSMSTGYQAATSWRGPQGVLTAGSDLRYVKQELNELAVNELEFTEGNSPIPRSINPILGSLLNIWRK